MRSSAYPQALRAYRDRDTLFRSLARELRPVVGFSFLSVGLYDERTHTVESSVLEASGEPLPPPRLSADESLTYFVIQQQKPLLIPDVELETRFPEGDGATCASSRCGRPVRCR